MNKLNGGERKGAIIKKGRGRFTVNKEEERKHQARVEAGRKGGKAPRKRPRWFAEHPELAKKWASVGGKNSRRFKKNGD